jgi:hypothetical protein
MAGLLDEIEARPDIIPPRRRSARISLWKGPLRAAFFSQTTLRFSAEDLPRFGSLFSSNETRWPSFKPLNPARSTADMWTKISGTAIFCFNKSKTLCRIEPLHCASRHHGTPMFKRQKGLTRRLRRVQRSHIWDDNALSKKCRRASPVARQ